MKRATLIVAILLCATTAVAMGGRPKNLNILGSDDHQRKRTTTAPVPVPEPATIILLGAGLVGLAALGRKKS